MAPRTFLTLRQALLLSLTMAFLVTDAPAREEKPDILCTTFPIYQITRNVTRGRDSVTVGLMLPSQLGCPHDYALTPRDMQKIAKAEVLIINGLGLEEFMGSPVRQANHHVKIVDSSVGIRQTLRYTWEEKHGHEGAHGAGRGHHHGGVNPHLFASPRMAALLAANIAEGLARIDPAGASTYRKNAKAYGDKLNRLANDLSSLGRMLRNNRIVTQHGVFDYLARDMGLEVVAVLQGHAGQDPSASEMLKIVKVIRQKKAGAVFTEPQYPEKIGRTVAREAGVPSARLDPGATGPESAGLDYYEITMRKNMEIIRRTLGVR